MKAVESSGKILHMFNLGQIQRMKIRKNEFTIKPTVTSSPELFADQAISPFAQKIKSMKMNVYGSVLLRNEGEIDNKRPNLKADWQRYQLVLFNLMQNSVKYNNYK